MTAKLKAKKPAAPAPKPVVTNALPPRRDQPPYRTPEERVQDIEQLYGRVTEYVQFMSKVAQMKGTSAEAKDRALAAFHDRLARMERELGKIQEELMLG